ncbi:leucyl/phenylalanyl-tRNA--protein transferase [Oceanospirillum maris]|jgi:leucyl/phenylalanyl-tRNA--protein transferase|uniref:leucyl/phenylalanyl-tRNA--protein transferase n=1 Tax=Oceanospirillum maris TaxID=64977 RepID=UPI000418D434|nr:leucyl/phenylalanyl-tRNA--protein transferase [Oceanospirillum maris]
MIELPWLDPEQPPLFPSVDEALSDPPGLLAFGGQLNAHWLLHAYQSGIFPWFNPGEPILWWSPSPRMVILPAEFKVRRSLKKTLRKQLYDITFDQDFKSVLEGCAAARNYTEESWLTPEMRQAYLALHHAGYAHSVEAWQDGQLVGGLYGVAIGRIFCGESMFAKATDASKVAFVHLVEQLKAWKFELIDCQVYTDHLASFGAKEIERQVFLGYLAEYANVAMPLESTSPELWCLEQRIKESVL